SFGIIIMGIAEIELPKLLIHGFSALPDFFRIIAIEFDDLNVVRITFDKIAHGRCLAILPAIAEYQLAENFNSRRIVFDHSTRRTYGLACIDKLHHTQSLKLR